MFYQRKITHLSGDMVLFLIIIANCAIASLWPARHFEKNKKRYAYLEICECRKFKNQCKR